MSDLLTAIETALKPKKKTKPKEFKSVAVSKGETPKIVIPKGMSYEQASVWLKRQEEHEETEVDFSATLNVHPMDGAKALSGQIPAVIREAVERAKLYAIHRGVVDAKIVTQDLEHAAKQIVSQVNTLKTLDISEATRAERFESSLRDVLEIPQLTEQVKSIKGAL